MNKKTLVFVLTLALMCCLIIDSTEVSALRRRCRCKNYCGTFEFPRSLRRRCRNPNQILCCSLRRTSTGTIQK
ncbi:hypothetical protein ACF0H5_019302 [Mactra antiquata]